MSIAIWANGIEFNLNILLNGNGSILCQIFKRQRAHPPLQGIGGFSNMIYDTGWLGSYEQIMNNANMTDFN